MQAVARSLFAGSEAQQQLQQQQLHQQQQLQQHHSQQEQLNLQDVLPASSVPMPSTSLPSLSSGGAAPPTYQQNTQARLERLCQRAEAVAAS